MVVCDGNEDCVEGDDEKNCCEWILCIQLNYYDIKILYGWFIFIFQKCVLFILQVIYVFLVINVLMDCVFFGQIFVVKYFFVRME